MVQASPWVSRRSPRKIGPGSGDYSVLYGVQALQEHQADLARGSGRRPGG